MVVVFPVPENERSAKALLRMLVEQGHMDSCAASGKTVFSVVLDDWQVDLMSSYGVTDADLEDSDDDEDECAL